MTDAVRGAMAEARARVERLSADYFCEHPEGDAARSGGGLCDECVAIYVDDLLAARDAAWRKAVARVRMLHSASCLRWIRNDDSQPCSCDDTTKIHNAALDALLAAMEGK